MDRMISSNFIGLIPRELIEMCAERDTAGNILLGLGDHVERVSSVMFIDIRNFTALAEEMTTQQGLRFINSYLGQMDEIITANNGVIDKFMGDGIMAVFPHGVNSAMESAVQMIAKIVEYNKGRVRAGYRPIKIGIGLNTGIVMVCVIGGKHRTSVTVIGDAVNLSARLESATKDYQVPFIISQSSMYDVDVDKYNARLIDRIKVKGKTQPVSIYEVFTCDDNDMASAKKATIKDFEIGVAFYHMKDVSRAQVHFELCVDMCSGDMPAQIYLQRCKDFMVTGVYSGSNEFDNRIEWNESHNFNIQAMDSIRAEVISKIEMISSADSPGKLIKILRFLFWHSKSMFPVEEFMMKSDDYHLRINHNAEHVRFLLSLDGLIDNIKSERMDIRHASFNARVILVDWLMSHIAGSDRHFIRFHNDAKST